MRPDAPDRYTVVPGDTLWSIASRLLKSPWRWPELWEMNRAQIRNPHRIYPGDVIVLERKGSEVFAWLETTRLSPQVRVEMVESASIPVYRAVAYRTVSVEAAGGRCDRARRCAANYRDTGRPRRHRQRQHGLCRKSRAARHALAGLPAGRSLIDPETKETLGYRRDVSGGSRARATRQDQHDGDHQGRAGDLSWRQASPDAPG